jgi:16S rRNA (adenine1518-N6/adenine1519-N6)-dimethyltransferase
LRAAEFDTLVEVGPGGGALTGQLFPKYGPRMKTIEIDPELVPALRKKFEGLEVINKDFMTADLEAESGPGRIAFIGNLPYDCATAILERVLAFGRFSFAVFMFQKEVARRITSEPGGSEYGCLTLLTAARASAELLLDVKAGSFRPVPAVDSSVLVFRPRPYFSDPALAAHFTGTVKKSFAHRRKTLVNSLSLCGVNKAAALEAVLKVGLKPTARAQELDLDTFAALSTALAGK